MQVKLKLTNREKKLLIVLGICMVAALVYYAVIKPQLDMVGRLQKQAEEYSIKIQRAKEKVNPANPTYKEYNELYDNTQALLKTFYPSIIQEKIILMLRDKLDAAKLIIKEMTFTEPALAEMEPPKAEQLSQVKQTDELQALTEQLNNITKSVANNKAGKAATNNNPLSLEKMTVTINYEGSSYSQIYGFIKAVEQENRSIACSSLTAEAGDSGLLKGVITMDIYYIPKPFIQDENYLNWDIQGKYGKANPFGNAQAAPANKNAVAPIINP